MLCHYLFSILQDLSPLLVFFLHMVDLFILSFLTFYLLFLVFSGKKLFSAWFFVFFWFNFQSTISTLSLSFGMIILSLSDSHSIWSHWKFLGFVVFIYIVLSPFVLSYLWLCVIHRIWKTICRSILRTERTWFSSKVCFHFFFCQVLGHLQSGVTLIRF